jgi:hypothetical protein
MTVMSCLSIEFPENCRVASDCACSAERGIAMTLRELFKSLHAIDEKNLDVDVIGKPLYRWLQPDPNRVWNHCERLVRAFPPRSRVKQYAMRFGTWT